MLDKFSWLHLSDFHFRADGDPFSQTVSADALRVDAPSRISGEYPLQFVVITGDIAFSGKPTEYEVAAAFVRSLASELDVDMNRFFVVPGNHDVDRTTQQYLYHGAHQQLTNQQAVDDFLGNDDERRALLERQAAFRAFREEFPADSAQETPDGLARVRSLDLDGLRVCILELNSAWLSGSSDQAGNLILGERQIIGALELVNPHAPHLTIGLTHHPLDWISDFDWRSCRGRLLPSLNILQSGHLHRYEMSAVVMPGTECLLIGAGSSHATRHYENSYNLVEFDVGASKCTVHQFVYVPEAGSFTEQGTTPYRMILGGSPPNSAELAGLLRDPDPELEAYAEYLGALLAGDMHDVPIRLSASEYIFGSQELPLELQVQEVRDFLRLSNLIRLSDNHSLEEALAPHRETISHVRLKLRQIASESSEFASRLDDRIDQARQLSSREAQSQPHQVEYLDELARSGPWEELVETARRYTGSSVKAVRISACRHVAAGLLRVQGEDAQREGFALARQNMTEPWSDVRDHIIASTAATLVGDPEQAESIALAALEEWPGDRALLEHCRSLALTTGSRILAQRLRATGGSEDGE